MHTLKTKSQFAAWIDSFLYHIAPWLRLSPVSLHDVSKYGIVDKVNYISTVRRYLVLIVIIRTNSPQRVRGKAFLETDKELPLM